MPLKPALTPPLKLIVLPETVGSSIHKLRIDLFLEMLLTSNLSTGKERTASAELIVAPPVLSLIAIEKISFGS